MLLLIRVFQLVSSMSEQALVAHVDKMTRWSFSLTPWSVQQMQTASKPAQPGNLCRSFWPRECVNDIRTRRKNYTICILTSVHDYLVSMWPPPRTIKDDPSSISAVSFWCQYPCCTHAVCCAVFICVVYGGMNVWVLSDQNWTACMCVIGCLVGMKLDEARKCVTLTVGSCLCTARSNRQSCLVVLQCCKYICRSNAIFLPLCNLTVLLTEGHFGNRFFGT